MAMSASSKPEGQDGQHLVGEGNSRDFIDSCPGSRAGMGGESKRRAGGGVTRTLVPAKSGQEEVSVAASRAVAGG